VRLSWLHREVVAEHQRPKMDRLVSLPKSDTMSFGLWQLVICKPAGRSGRERVLTSQRQLHHGLRDDLHGM
jgi:hypothetical protein